MSDFQIRRARASDVVALNQLIERVKVTKAKQPLCSYWYDNPIIHPKLLRYSITWVAEQYEGIVGFWLHQLTESEQDVQKSIVCVEPRYQRQGCATQLWLALQRLLYPLRLSKICFQAEPEAQGFYTKLGAKPMGEIRSPVIKEAMIPLLRLPIRWVPG